MTESWIDEEIRTAKLSIQKLPEAETTFLVKGISDIFCNGVESTPIWHSLANEGKRRTDGWREAAKLVGNHECVLLVEDDTSKIAYDVLNGRVIEQLLSECPGFEFYLFDRSMTYLMCHNDHDYLIGCGLAVEWISRLQEV